MNESTIRRLNAMNRDFYALTVQNFDESRGRPWPGWKRLLPTFQTLAQVAPFRVLDVGCGNGRFGRFLARNLDSSRPIAYHGQDHTLALLDAARAAFAQMRILPEAVLEQRDILEAAEAAGQYDLVVVFGVVHHIPGRERRCEVLRGLARQVASGGMLVFTSWCFYEYERFRERLIAWPADLESEPGDYIMDWRRGHEANTALRYCHYVDSDEQAALVMALGESGLTEIDAFRADGHTNDINRYSVLQKQPG